MKTNQRLQDLGTWKDYEQKQEEVEDQRRDDVMMYWQYQWYQINDKDVIEEKIGVVENLHYQQIVEKEEEQKNEWCVMDESAFDSFEQYDSDDL